MRHGRDLVLFNLSQDHFTDNEQRAKLNSFFSSREKLLSGVPEGSNLDSLLFNIYMCNMFFITKNTYFTGYVNNKTSFVARDVIKVIEKIGKPLLRFFQITRRN